MEAVLVPRLGRPRPADVWDDDAAPVDLDRLRDEHWRVSEMCRTVSVRHELPCGDEAVRLAGHELSRVRAAAARAQEPLESRLDL